MMNFDQGLAWLCVHDDFYEQCIHIDNFQQAICGFLMVVEDLRIGEVIFT